MFDDLQKLASTENREAWLAARRGGVTATDIARLASGGPGEWERVRDEKKGLDTFKGNMYTQWGLEREEPIGRKVNAQFGLDFVANSHVHAVNGGKYMATPDMIGPYGLCQIKTALHTQSWVRPPKKYVDQCQWEMMVMGAAYNVLVVEWSERHTNVETGVVDMRTHDPDMPLSSFVIERDDNRIIELRSIADMFLGVKLDATLDSVLEKLAFIRESIAGLKAQETMLLQDVREHVGEGITDYRYISSHGSVSVIPGSVAVKVDRDVLRDEFPEVWEKVTTQSVSAPRWTIK